tara:strand:+ start:307 stop:480 length:174 start_codon:yes stop_codon:yes gene_type:complete
MLCLVIDNKTNTQVNIIVAEESDLPQEGCRLVAFIEGMYWDGQQLSPVPVVDRNNGY